MINLEYLQLRFDTKMMNREARKNCINNTGRAIGDGRIFICLTNGVRIIYKDGTKRFISNNWYN